MKQRIALLLLEISGMIYTQVANDADVQRLMKAQSLKFPGCHCIHIDFCEASITTYTNPSKIPALEVGDTPNSYKGYWKQGKFYPFSERLTTEHVNDVYSAVD